MCRVNGVNLSSRKKTCHFQPLFEFCCALSEKNLEADWIFLSCGEVVVVFTGVISRWHFLSFASLLWLCTTAYAQIYPYYGQNYCPFCPLCGYVIDTARRLRGWSSALAYGGRVALTLVRSWLPPDGIGARPRKPTSVDRRVRALPLVCQYTAVNRWTA